MLWEVGRRMDIAGIGMAGVALCMGVVVRLWKDRELWGVVKRGGIPFVLGAARPTMLVALGELVRWLGG